MSDTKVRRMHGERGASLILAIAFMVVMGSIGAAVITTTSTGIQERVALDTNRNREYDADAAVEKMIASVRSSAPATCPSPIITPTSLNGTANMRVECHPAPDVIIGPGGVLQTQNNLDFTACDTGSTACNPQTTIITAQISYQGSSPSQTLVQAWSVNR